VKRRVTVSIRGDLLEAAWRRAGQRTLSSVVEEALDLYLNMGERLAALEASLRRLEMLLDQCIQREQGGQQRQEETRRGGVDNIWVEILRRRQGLSPGRRHES